MVNQLVECYNCTLNKLEEENKEYEDRLIAKLARVISGKSMNDENTADNTQEHRFFQLTYNCVQVYLCCRLVSEGLEDYETKLQENITKVIENIKEIERRREVSDAILLESLNVLNLICLDYKKLIVSNFPKFRSMFKLKRKVSSDLFYFISEIVDCLIENGDKEIAANIAENLCDSGFPKKDIKQNITLILNILSNTTEVVPEVAYRICLKMEPYFDNKLDLASGDFYWFYSYAAHVTDRKDAGIKYLKKCVQIRKKVMGENWWYTVVAECELEFRVMTSPSDLKMRKFFDGFINGVENGVFYNMDTEYAKSMEGRCLFALLNEDPGTDSMERYRYYVDLFEKLCNQPMKYPLPILTPRMGKNIKGACCLREENYIKAEKCFLEALEYDEETDPSGTIISDEQIKSNLLLTYFNQNDQEKTSELLDELLVVIREDNNKLSKSDEYRIMGILVSTYSYFDISNGEMESILEVVREDCDDMLSKFSELNKFSSEDKEQVTFILSAIDTLMFKQQLGKEDYWLFYNALNEVKKYSGKMMLEKRRIVCLNFILSALAYNLELSTTESLIKESLLSLESSNVPRQIRIAVFSSAAMYYAKNTQVHIAKKYLEKVCVELNDIWKKKVSYLSDYRLMNALVYAQFQHYIIYTIYRQIYDIQSSYNNVIQFKALASLAGRERNRVVNSGKIDLELIKRIHNQQNIVAQLETDAINTIDEESMTEAYKKMRLLEIEFAEKFPEIGRFTDISLERIATAMPDNTVVIEYFDTIPCYGKTLLEENDVEEECCIDVFLLKKKNGLCTLGKYVINKGELVLKKAEEFIKIYQDISNEEATTAQLDEQDQIRYFLYKELILPIKEYIVDMNTLYIAPSAELINLPFGLLMENNDANQLQEDYYITMIECARDFIFTSNLPDISDSTLVMGDPEYDLKGKLSEDTHISDEQRCLDFQDFSIESLPFSGIEAIRISNIASADCLLGINASKNVLLSATNYKSIHIATHGLVDYDSSEDALYASCILLSGAQNWLLNGTINSDIGNGVVTADEISRQDWHHVELVVLSTCMSGMNDFTINKGFNGMVSALSAAGVKYVICSLWNQSDFGTAIMMEEFYRLYKKEGKQPFEALREAQNYLKNVTIGELKDKGWLNITDYRVKDVIDQYSSMNDRRRPFKNEVYWGGFECFRCN